MDWFVGALKKYAVFHGRARRKEFWYFQLFYIIFFCVSLGVDYSLGIVLEGEVIGPLSLIYFLATFLPMLAVSMRRLHDTGHRGWWWLMNLIPWIPLGDSDSSVRAIQFGIGLIWIGLMVENSQFGENRFGANPKDLTV